MSINIRTVLSLGSCSAPYIYNFFAEASDCLIFFSRWVLAGWQSMDNCPGFKCPSLVQLAGAGARESFG